MLADAQPDGRDHRLLGGVFTTKKVRTWDDPPYVDFERAFVLADGYVAAAFLTAARCL